MLTSVALMGVCLHGLAGGEEFIYQSCTPAAQDGGAMSGWFTFVEGSLTQPTGPEFEAMVRPNTHTQVFLAEQQQLLHGQTQMDISNYEGPCMAVPSLNAM